MARFARVASIVLAVAYPFVVYLGLARSSPRVVAIALVAIAVALVLSRARGLTWPALRGAVTPVLPTVIAGTIAGLTDARWALLAAPVLVNLLLLVAFATSLRAGAVPMIERFARLQDPGLGAPQRAHCRQVTGWWIGFFAVNAVISGVLAVAAPFAWWTLWCGALAYVAIGVMIAVEWCVRRLRFGPGTPRASVP